MGVVVWGRDYIDPQLSSSEIEAYHSLSYHNDDEILTNKISVKEVTAAIRKLKMSKSAGPNGLSLEHFRYPIFMDH